MRMRASSHAGRLPHFREEAATCVPVLSGSGLRLSGARYVRADGSPSIRISGVCQVRDGELEALRVSLLEAVSLLVVYRPTLRPVSFSPCGQALVFGDDVRRVNGYRRAFFEIDLFQQARMEPWPGAYDISGSLGVYLAPVVRVAL